MTNQEAVKDVQNKADAFLNEFRSLYLKYGFDAGLCVLGKNIETSLLTVVLSNSGDENVRLLLEHVAGMDKPMTFDGAPVVPGRKGVVN